VTRRRHRRAQRGQTLVIFAGGIAGLLALVGLVVDGANAYAQHRGAQNAADAASQAGAGVLARAILQDTTPVDHDVKSAMNAIATQSNVKPFFPFTSDASIAYYTDVDGTLLQSGGNPIRVGLGAVPACDPSKCVNGLASGVQVIAVRPFRALLAGVVGQETFTARTTATSVAGFLKDPCDAAEGCPLLPVAVSAIKGACLPDGTPDYGIDPWAEADAPLVSANEVSLPLCREPATAEWPGATSWIDFECGSLANQIRNPCNVATEFPTWVPAWDGGTSGVVSALSGYHGGAIGTYEAGSDLVVLVPVFDGVCHADKADTVAPTGPGFPQVCPGDPASGPIHVHLPKFVAFAVDGYLDGSAVSGCNLAPVSGATSAMASEATSTTSTRTTTTTTTTTTTGPVEACLRGWFADAVLPPGPVGTEPFEDGSPRPLTIQLVK
jgi:hypothetical protein